MMLSETYLCYILFDKNSGSKKYRIYISFKNAMFSCIVLWWLNFIYISLPDHIWGDFVWKPKYWSVTKTKQTRRTVLCPQPLIPPSLLHVVVNVHVLTPHVLCSGIKKNLLQMEVKRPNAGTQEAESEMRQGSWITKPRHSSDTVNLAIYIKVTRETDMRQTNPRQVNPEVDSNQLCMFMWL